MWRFIRNCERDGRVFALSSLRVQQMPSVSCHAISITRIIQLQGKSVLLMRQILTLLFWMIFHSFTLGFLQCITVFLRLKLSFSSCLSVSGILCYQSIFNPLNPELNPTCYLLALLGAHHYLHVSRIMVKLLTFRLLMSYIYGAPILDVSRSHTTTQHSR